MNTSLIQPEILLTDKQVAAQFGIAAKTVWAWSRQGKFSRVKLGDRITRFKQSEIDALIAERTVRAEPTK